MDPIIESVLTGPIDVNCFVIGDPETGEAAVIDPGGHPGRILSLLTRHRLQPKLIINTHGHFDHVGGNAGLMRETGAELLIHEDGLEFLRNARLHADMWGMEFDDSPEPTQLLRGGEELEVGGLIIRVLHTPGHSPGGISLCIPGHVFTGDALFMGSIGRTDLPGGDYPKLISSIRERILTLPPDTVVHPGHGPDTTIGIERDSNPFLQ